MLKCHIGHGNPWLEGGPPSLAEAMMGRQLDSQGQLWEQINDSLEQNPAYDLRKLKRPFVRRAFFYVFLIDQIKSSAFVKVVTTGTTISETSDGT